MKKKILGVFFIFVFITILTIPVYASPTKGQKVSIAIHWTSLSTIPDVPRETGIVRHNFVLVNWSVVIDVDEVIGAWTGFANNTGRKVTNIPGPDGNTIIFQETYDMKITGFDGGFKGSSLILLDGVGGPDPYMGKAHGLLRGYGDFEGQTINAGHHWVPPGPPTWWGYLLKP